MMAAIDTSHTIDEHRCTDEVGEPADVIVDLSSKELDFFCVKTNNGTNWELVTDLDLAFNNLSSLPSDLPSHLPSIKVLDISGNIFRTLPTILGELTTIVSLKANESCISEIAADSLSCLSKLKHLSLVGNTLSDISDQFHFPENLESLYLDESELRILPESICALQKLTIIEAANNALVTLPGDFGRICSLEVINLCHNKLVALPESFSLLEKVQVMDISHNCLTEMPEEFGSVDTLLSLYANHNRLESLPEWTSCLTNLETLSVKDNVLLGKPLDEQFCENVKDTLKTFLIGGNFIEHLPTNLGLLSRVEFFHIGSIIGELERANFQNGNWIRNLPDNFGAMVGLRKLRLDENQFTNLPDNFGDLVNLEFLDLGQNRLRHLPGSFCNLRSLKKCMLSKNCLQELPDEFGNLSELRELFLNANELRALPQSMVKLTNLKILDLFDNKLSTIPEFLDSLTQLNALDLDCNSFDIDELEVPRKFKANYYASDRKKFGAGSAKTVNGTSLTPLVLALQKKSMWASHGETRDRKTVQGRQGSSEGNGMSSVNSQDEVDSEAGFLDGSFGSENWDEELEESPYADVNVYEHPVKKSSPRGQPAVDFYFLPSREHALEAAPTVFHNDIEDGQFDDAD